MKLFDKILLCPDENGWTNPNITRAEKLEKLADEHAILFSQFIAENHYVLVNKIGKIYYWKNEYGLKTTVQLMEDFKK